MQILNLFIVADDPLARAGLAVLLASHPDCQVVGQLNGADLLSDIQDGDGQIEKIDALIWDLGWDFAGDSPAWQEIDRPIVALVPDAEETAVLWSTGVMAVLPRSSSADHIIAAAQAATLGLITVDPEIAHFPNTVTTNSELDPDEELTPRELQVIQLIAEGMTNKAIAQHLNISAHTVKFHVNAIMNKLSVQSRTEAVVRATRIGLISL